MIIDGRKVIRAVCIVHVDDLQFAGIIEVVVPLLERLQKKVKLQVEGPFLTPEEREAGYSLQHVRFLKRKFTYEDHELRISIDPKYVKKLTEVLQLDKKQSRKPKQTPCTSSSSEPDNSAALAPAEAATYRSAVGMLLYVAHDRPDIQFSVRSLSCGMKEPTEKKFKELQHLALYMKGAADYIAVFKKTKKGQSVLSASNLSSSQGGVPEEEEQQHEGEHLLEVFSDSDWAGDKESRRSVSCACVFLGGNCFFSYSRTQKSIALSSAEAEYLSLTGAASEALNIHIALRFLTASPVVLKAFTDSSACRGICARQGVGRIKHLAVRLLWLQQAIRAGRLTVHSVPTQQNPADIGTKPLTAKRIQQSSGEAKGKKSEEPGKEKKKTTSTSTASSSQKVPEPEEEVVRLQALVEGKEEAINDLADDLAKVRAIVAEKEKKVEELEERHSKLADYYEKDNANIKKYNQDLINKNEAFVEEIKQLRYKHGEKDKLIDNLKTIAAVKAKEMPKKPKRRQERR